MSFLSGLIVREPDGKLVVGSTTAIATVCSFGMLAYWALGLSSGGPGSPSVPSGEIGKPNAPIINAVNPVVDSISLEVSMNAFAGSGGDTHDSTRILVDSAGKGFGTPILDSLMGPQTTDTVKAAFVAGGVYDFVALYKGTTGDWSDTSQIFQRQHSFSPGDPVLIVRNIGPDSVVIKFVAVGDGKGGRANYDLRRDITPPMTWWTQDSTTQVDSSRSVAVGDTVIMVSTGLPSSTTVEFQAIAYRGYLGVSPVAFGNLSNIVSATTEASPWAGPQMTSMSWSDSSTVALISNAYGGAQSHDSTHWQVCRYATNCSASLVDSISGVNKTSVTVVSNANFKADTLYSSRVRYRESGSGWTGWSDTITKRAPAPSPPSNEPIFNPGTDSNYFFDGFEGFTSSAQVLTYQSVIPGCYVKNGETVAGSTFDLTTSGAFEGTKAVRFTYTASGGAQQDKLIECTTANFPTSLGVLIVTFNFRTQPGYAWTNVSGNTHKMFNMNIGGGGNASRMLLSFGAEPLTPAMPAYGPLFPGDRPNFSIGENNYNQNLNYDKVRTGSGGSQIQMNDGNWHRVTFRITRSTSRPTLTTGNGRIEMWVDGIKVVEYFGDDGARPESGLVNVPTSAEGNMIPNFHFPSQRNANTGGQNIWVEFDAIRVWRKN